VQANDIFTMRWNSFNTYAFEETVFIAVTAYQNEQVSTASWTLSTAPCSIFDVSHGTCSNQFMPSTSHYNNSLFGLLREVDKKGKEWRLFKGSRQTIDISTSVRPLICATRY
jgi:hypothetical protein